MKPASGRRIDGTGDLALGDGIGAPELGIRHRHGRQQRLRVRVCGTLVDVRPLSEFDDPTEIHDRNPG